MVAVVSLLLVVALSLLVVRIGAIALMMTGLSEDVAQFQALSAFSGAGFTANEAESVVGSPPRRRIVTLLIRLGSAGIVTAISALMLSFIGAGEAAPVRLLVLVLGGLALIALARSRALNRLLTPLIERALARYTTLEIRDYAALLHQRPPPRARERERVAFTTKRDVLGPVLEIYDDVARPRCGARPGPPRGVRAARAGRRAHGGESFRAALRRLGVERVEAVGRPFDQDLHEAALRQPATSDVPPGHVLAEVRPGYRLDSEVLRHARVVVAADDA